MKKLVLFMALTLVLSLCACSSAPAETSEPVRTPEPVAVTDEAAASKPEETVIKFSEAMQAYDIEAMDSFLLKPDTDALLSEYGFEDSTVEGDVDVVTNAVISKMERWAGNMKYELGDVSTDGDLAQVKVKYTYVDASPIIQEFAADLLDRAYAGEFDDSSEEEIEVYLTQLIKEKLVATKVGESVATVTYPLVLVNNEWKIMELPEELENVLTFNLSTSIGEMEELFGEYE